jgi:hypothetical protein
MDRLAMPGRCSRVDLGGLDNARNPISSVTKSSSFSSFCRPFPFHLVDTPGSMLVLSDASLSRVGCEVKNVIGKAAVVVE